MFALHAARETKLAQARQRCVANACRDCRKRCERLALCAPSPVASASQVSVPTDALVNVIVFEEVGFLPERLAARLALEGLLAGVRAQVDLDVGLVEEAAVADSAAVHQLVLGALRGDGHGDDGPPLLGAAAAAAAAAAADGRLGRVARRAVCDQGSLEPLLELDVVQHTVPGRRRRAGRAAERRWRTPVTGQQVLQHRAGHAVGDGGVRRLRLATAAADGAGAVVPQLRLRLAA